MTSRVVLCLMTRFCRIGSRLKHFIVHYHNVSPKWLRWYSLIRIKRTWPVRLLRRQVWTCPPRLQAWVNNILRTWSGSVTQYRLALRCCEVTLDSRSPIKWPLNFHSLVFKRLARLFILSILSAVTVVNPSALRASMLIEENLTARRITRNCFVWNVVCASGRSAAENDGWRPWENLGTLLALNVR